MTPKRVWLIERERPQTPRQGSPRLAGLLALGLLAAPALAAGGAIAPAMPGGGGLRLITENDFLAGDEDDLYSFGFGLEANRFPYTWSLRESGFTDRAAGRRFDETSLTVGRPLALPGGWQGWGEAGVTRVGRGLLGERVQNELHRLIGSDEVDLRYLRGDSYHLSAIVVAARSWPLRRGFAVGPHLELAAAPGLKSHALAAGLASWSGGGPWALSLLVGARASDADLAALRPRMGGLALQAELALVYRQRIVVSWSTNAFGTEQEHLALGYRVRTSGDGPTRASR